MTESARVLVEVVFALPGWAQVSRVDLAAGATVAEAIAAAGLDGVLSEAGAGVWGRRVPGEFVLRQGDRVEIYRPLRADPKESRRRRAAAKRSSPSD